MILEIINTGGGGQDGTASKDCKHGEGEGCFVGWRNCLPRCCAVVKTVGGLDRTPVPFE